MWNVRGIFKTCNTPVNLNTGNDVNQFQLPSSDYPDPVRYVSPGVVLLVNDMKEIDHEGKDKFVPTNVTVTVTCKPKHSYPSTATNWANDLTATQYLFRKEHEVPSDNSSDERHYPWTTSRLHHWPLLFLQQINHIDTELLHCQKDKLLKTRLTFSILVRSRNMHGTV